MAVHTITKDGETIGWYDDKTMTAEDRQHTYWENILTREKAQRLLECSAKFEKDMAEILAKE